MSAHGPPEVPGGRSIDERERAREERDARRSRSGRFRREGEEAGTRRTPPPRGLGDRGNGASRKPSRRARAAEPPPAQPDGRRRRRGGRVLLGLLAILAAAGAYVGLSYYQPFAGPGNEPVRVQVPSGASVGDIATILEQRGVISSPLFFQARARFDGAATELKPGVYTLRRDASHTAVLDALVAGVAPDVTVVTVPEGLSRRELAPTVADAGLGRGYLRATEEAPEGFEPRRYGAPRSASLEGFLYPASYEVKRGASAATLVARQLDTFEREVAGVDMRGSRRRNLTPYDVLTVASMIEREAQVNDERRVIASVIYNRLKDGEPLAIDATTRYATRNWSSPLKQSELAIDSPYNTRLNAGLPPGPIGNPGRASIDAAANPATTDFRYYVVKPCADGAHEFSETGAEFEQDKAAYENERARQGGRSPTDC
ncbi:MAG: endolytic transglycosylase MltG [Thermoleophilaceae bacterium]